MVFVWTDGANFSSPFLLMQFQTWWTFAMVVVEAFIIIALIVRVIDWDEVKDNEVVLQLIIKLLTNMHLSEMLCKRKNKFSTLCT